VEIQLSKSVISIIDQPRFLLCPATTIGCPRLGSVRDPTPNVRAGEGESLARANSFSVTDNVPPKTSVEEPRGSLWAC
jgi:hypothetical protein